jgi:hypothetical protein
VGIPVTGILKVRISTGLPAELIEVSTMFLSRYTYAWCDNKVPNLVLLHSHQVAVKRTTAI